MTELNKKFILINHMFEDITVPFRIRHAASEICFRFNILGAADGLRISNIIAEISESGNGNGIFTGNNIMHPEKIANMLSKSYESEIPFRKQKELVSILESAMSI